MLVFRIVTVLILYASSFFVSCGSSQSLFSSLHDVQLIQLRNCFHFLSTVDFPLVVITMEMFVAVKRLILELKYMGVSRESVPKYIIPK